MLTILSGPSSFGALFGVDNVLSIERTKVRVFFTEAPKTVNRENPDDALNVTNWTIEVIPPASGEDDPIVAYYTPSIVRVDRVEDDDLSVDVVFDDDLSFGVQYRIIASADIRSTALGSWGVSSAVSGEFYPYDPYCRSKPIPRVYDWFGTAVKRFDYTRDAERLSALLQDIFEQVKYLSECIGDLFDPERTPEGFLDARLEGLGNPFSLISSEMTLSEKRLLAMQLVKIYRGKGTITGMKDAIVRVCGFDPGFVSVDVANQRYWGLDKDPERQGGLFKLGHREYSSSYTPPPGLTGPLDPYFSFNDNMIGTARLGPRVPQYFSPLTDGRDGHADQDRLAKIGAWTLAPVDVIAYPKKPSDITSTDPIDQPTVEKGRKQIYYYRISVNQSITTKELNCITAIAQYMQPAEMHLIAVVTPQETYVPNKLGTSRLDRDFTLAK